MTNSRNKGASFEREVANLLTNDLNLTKNIRRILEQTREKHLPDLMLGRWYLECKRYGSGAEPLDAWWKQVLEATKNKEAIEKFFSKQRNKALLIYVFGFLTDLNFNKDNGLLISLHGKSKVLDKVFTDNEWLTLKKLCKL